MKNQSISVYEDIDWQLLWQQSRSRKSWKSKDAKEWSKKGKSFAGRVRESAFIDLFLKHIVLDQNMSILDIGCGPGTLAVPIARQVKRVTEDNWSDFGITRHDIAIASRSMNIADLRSGLEKLNSYAAAKVYIVERIAPSPFDPDAFAAIGRPFNSGPDYIYTLNMLYTLGIHPHIDHIELNREQRFATIDRAMQNYRWMFKELTAEEERRLEKFLWKQIVRQETDHIIIKRNHPQRWVVISWTPEQID
ncbi:MAG: hypothetical protein P8X39_13245 [Desulfofustis sp.]